MVYNSFQHYLGEKVSRFLRYHRSKIAENRRNMFTITELIENIDENFNIDDFRKFVPRCTSTRVKGNLHLRLFLPVFTSYTYFLFFRSSHLISDSILHRMGGDVHCNQIKHVNNIIYFIFTCRCY